MQIFWLNSDRARLAVVHQPAKQNDTFLGGHNRLEQFVSTRKLEKKVDDLYEFLQHWVDPLRSYIARFNQEKISIPGCNTSTAISAFKRGMLRDGDLYKKLIKYQCKNVQCIVPGMGTYKTGRDSAINPRSLRNMNKRGQKAT